jgi:hypothetical protein
LHPRKLLDWKTALIYVHRWAGIVLGLVFVVWFVSGVAMMYVGMPRLSATERLGHVKPLDLSTARVEPADAAKAIDAQGRQLRIEMFYDGRPIYRFDGGLKVYADTGEPVPGASAEEAISFVKRWVGVQRGDVARLPVPVDAHRAADTGAADGRQPHTFSARDDHG